MTGPGPNSCLLGQVTGLLVFLYVKIFLPSILNSADFWSSTSCNVLDFELADKKDVKELGVSMDGEVQGYPIRPPKQYNSTKQAFWCTRNLLGIVWNRGRLDYSELATFLFRAIKGEYFAKRSNEIKILSNSLDKQAEILEVHGCPKVQDLFDGEMWICLSY